MTKPVRFGLNVDPNTGGLAIAERITAIADAGGGRGGRLTRARAGEAALPAPPARRE